MLHLSSLDNKPIDAVSVFTMRNYLHQPFACCFFCGISVVNVIILAGEIWHHVLDKTMYGFSVKLFSSIQRQIFLACDAFCPLFYALWQEGLGRKYFLCSVDTRFYKVILLFIASNMDLQQKWVVCFFWSSRTKDITKDSTNV